MATYRPEKNPLCIYCQQRPGDTEDHVFARSFFGQVQPEHAMKVPCCKECNQNCGDGEDRRMTLDEEWVRTIFATIGVGYHPAAARLLDNEIERSFQRSPKLKTTFEQMPLKLILEDKHERFSASIVAVDFAPADMKRINRVIRKIVKGLSYTYSEVDWPRPCPLPVDLPIKIHRLTPKAFVTTDRAFNLAPRHGAWTTMGSEGVVRYRAISESSTSHHVAWLLLFYNCLPFLAYAGPKDLNAIEFIRICAQPRR